MAAHTYWRLLFTALNDTSANNLLSVAEIQMRATAGGANQCTGGTVGGSSQNSTNTTPGHALDGSLSTLWTTSPLGTPPHWWRYQFAAPVEIVETVTNSGNSGIYSPRAYDVQWSDDGTTWTTAFSASGLGAANNTTWTANSLGAVPTRVSAQSIEVLGTAGGVATYGSHRYWRLSISANNGDTSFTVIGEAEFRATGGGADQTNPTTALTAATASTVNDANTTAAKAFDNTLSATGTADATYWSTASGSQTPCWLAYDFGSPVEVNQVAVGCARDVGRAPRTFTVEYSDNGTSWTTAWTVTDQTAWALGESRTFSGAAGSSGVPVRVSAQAVEALTNTWQIRLPKSYALAVLGPNPAALALQKSYALAVLHDPAVLAPSGSFNLSQTYQFTTFAVGANEIDITRLYAPAAGRLTTITFYAGGTAMVGQPVIYSSSGSFGVPAARLWYGAEVTVPANGSFTVEANLDFAGPGEIWVGIHEKTAANTRAFLRYTTDTDAAGAAIHPMRYVSATYGTPPATAPTMTAYQNAMSMRVLFAPTAGTDRTLSENVDLTLGSTSSGYSAAADELDLRKVTIASATTLNKIRLWGLGFRGNISIKPVIYADSANAPGARVAVGPAVSGIKPGAMDLPFSSDVSLSVGSYWVGFVSNGSWNPEGLTGTAGYSATVFKVVAGSYASPPDPAPAGFNTYGTTLPVALSTGETVVAATRRRPVVMICG